MPTQDRRAPLDEARRFLLFNIVETYLGLTDDEKQRYDIELNRESEQEVRAMQLTWAEKHYYLFLRLLLDGDERDIESSEQPY